MLASLPANTDVTTDVLASLSGCTDVIVSLVAHTDMLASAPSREYEMKVTCSAQTLI